MPHIFEHTPPLLKPHAAGLLSLRAAAICREPCPTPSPLLLAPRECQALREHQASQEPQAPQATQEPLAPLVSPLCAPAPGDVQAGQAIEASPSCTCCTSYVSSWPMRACAAPGHPARSSRSGLAARYCLRTAARPLRSLVSLRCLCPSAGPACNQPPAQTLIHTACRHQWSSRRSRCPRS